MAQVDMHRTGASCGTPTRLALATGAEQTREAPPPSPGVFPTHYLGRVDERKNAPGFGTVCVTLSLSGCKLQYLMAKQGVVQ